MTPPRPPVSLARGVAGGAVARRRTRGRRSRVLQMRGRARARCASVSPAGTLPPRTAAMSLIGWGGTLLTWVLDDGGGADGSIEDPAFRYRQPDNDVANNDQRDNHAHHPKQPRPTRCHSRNRNGSAATVIGAAPVVVCGPAGALLLLSDTPNLTRLVGQGGFM